MPQLDPSSFLSQLVWLALTFIPLFLILWKVALPKVGAALEARRQRIAADLDAATALKDEAAKVLAAYQKALYSAHEAARAELKKVADEAAASATKHQAELGAKLAAEIKAAEARIASAQDAALANIRDVAGEAAAAATERLIGVKVEGAALETALAEALKADPLKGSR
jgi:F-type H+-transporting ATPase subunit b